MRMTIHEYIWIFLGLLGSLWVSLGLLGSLWVFLGLLGSLWVSLGLLGTPSLLTQESLLVSFGLFEIFGSPWVSLDLLWPLFPLQPLILFFCVSLIDLLLLVTLLKGN